MGHGCSFYYSLCFHLVWKSAWWKFEILGYRKCPCVFSRPRAWTSLAWWTSGPRGAPASQICKGKMPFPGWPRSLTCDSNDLQVSTPARSHCRLLRFSIMICPNRSSMFTWERKGEAGRCQKGFSGSRICKIRQHHSISNQPWPTSANTQGRSRNRVQAQHGGLTRAYTVTAPRRATGRVVLGPGGSHATASTLFCGTHACMQGCKNVYSSITYNRKDPVRI